MFEIVKFYWWTESRGSRCTIMPSFVKIGQSIAEILQFFIVQNGGRRHLGFQIAKFHWLTGFRGPRCITVPNFVKIGQSIMEILQFLPRVAMLARYIPSSCVCLCVSVCLPVTLRYCITTAKRRIMQIMPHDSPGNQVFWCQRSWRNSNGSISYGGERKMQVGWENIENSTNSRASISHDYWGDIKED